MKLRRVVFKTGQVLLAPRQANNLGLPEHPEDLGISEWKGKNLSDESALGGFSILAEAGKIPHGTVLIVENLDRLRKGTGKLLARFDEKENRTRDARGRIVGDGDLRSNTLGDGASPQTV